ncbi:hypothetical protein ACWDA7_14095 [Streptomyces sp. NPDC001156]
MSRPNRKRLKLATIDAQILEAQGDKYVEVVFEDADGDEQTVRFLRQTWWPLPLVKQFTSGAPITDSDDETELSEVQSALDLSIATLRKVAHDKGMFDRLSEQLTLGHFNAIVELVTGGDEQAMSEGESSSSSE